MCILLYCKPLKHEVVIRGTSLSLHRPKIDELVNTIKYLLFEVSVRDKLKIFF